MFGHIAALGTALAFSALVAGGVLEPESPVVAAGSATGVGVDGLRASSMPPAEHWVFRHSKEALRKSTREDKSASHKNAHQPHSTQAAVSTDAPVSRQKTRTDDRSIDRALPSYGSITKRLDRKSAVSFRSVPVLVALRRLATIAGVNLVIGPEAEAAVYANGEELRISLSMRDATLRNMLNMVMRKSSLRYEVVDRAVYITTPDRLSRSAHVRVYDVRDISRPVQDYGGARGGGNRTTSSAR